MIQRIQSIFLLIVSASMISMLFFQTWQKSDASTGRNVIITPIYSLDKTMDQDAVMTTFPYAIVGMLVLVSAIIALLEIFKYKNRLIQIKLGALNALLISASLVVTMFLIYDIQNSFAPNIYGEYKYGIYLPVIALIFNLLANRFIRRDEKLVRSVDRLR